MVDVSKRLSGSPKVQPKPKLAKKWMSEPNLLGDDEDQTWIKERDNMEEEGVSFTQDVPELPNLVHINKQRVQLRPRRRPPTRDFVRSRASMDFDLSDLPDEIREEDEEIGQDEATENEDVGSTPSEGHQSAPTPPPKPAARNGFRLPTIGTEAVVLRKTKPTEIIEEAKPTENIEETAKSTKTQEEPDNNIHDFTPESSPEKKHKERKRFKIHLFKFRRSRKGKQNNGKTPANKEPEVKTNLTEALSMSVDSGARPLGEESRRRMPNRRSRKSEERGLNWLLGLFHKRNAPPSPESTEDTSKYTEEVPKLHATGNHGDTNSNGKPETNGTVPEVRVEGELTNGHMSHENEANETPESVSDIRKKFERTSAAF